MPAIVPFILLGLFVAVAIYGVYQFTRRRQVAVEERVRQYVDIEEEAAIAAQEEMQATSPVGKILQLFVGRGYFDRVEENLARADVPMRPSEYVLARVVLAAVGILVGFYLFGNPTLSALVLGCLGFLAPAIFVKVHQNKRRTKFVRQLADALMLLTNSLRSGYKIGRAHV